MTGTRAPQFEWGTTSRVLSEDRVFEPSAEVIENANITEYMRKKGFSTYDELLKWSIENSEEFWAEMAGDLHWFTQPTQTLDWQMPDAKWFVGGKTNIAYNALDRHMKTSVRNRVAFYWEGEDGSTRTVSYADLYYEVSKFANALRSLGIEKGDRVIIYLPRLPEQWVAMLAIARIGAVHSVVYSGLSAQALRDRAQDAEAKAVITADGFYLPRQGRSSEDDRGCGSTRVSNREEGHHGQTRWQRHCLAPWPRRLVSRPAGARRAV